MNQSTVKLLRTDPGWFINQLNVRICSDLFLCTWAFPLCILVLFGKLTPLSFLNTPPPPPPLDRVVGNFLKRFCPGGRGWDKEKIS